MVAVRLPCPGTATHRCPMRLRSGAAIPSGALRIFTMASSNRVACAGARDRGTCENRLTIRRDEVKARAGETSSFRSGAQVADDRAAPCSSSRRRWGLIFFVHRVGHDRARSGKRDVLPATHHVGHRRRQA